MRNHTQWYRPLRDDLDKSLCDVELGLYLLSILIPGATADSLWVLLTGYPYSLQECQNWIEECYRMLAIARHLLPSFERPVIWEEALKHYRELTSDIRAYEVDESLQNFQRRTNITVANNRFQIYQDALTQVVELSQRKNINWAVPGLYKCEAKGKKETVEILPELANLPRPPSHNLDITSQRDALQVSWNELRETADWMDRQRRNRELQPNWLNRFNQIRLRIFNNNQELIDAEYLTINRMMHLAGMVSSGKSNLMKILTVWAWHNKLRVTLIVADILQIFDLIETFDEVGIKDIAPILGNSNKASHLNRLHRAVYNSNPNEIFNQNHPAFQWLSNTCLLTPFIQPKLETAFEIGKQPCFNLEPIETEESESSSQRRTCPAYGICPYHKKERDLVNPSIRIGTPGSLIYSRVPRPINRENILYFELVCRRSDLVIIDEVDQHQAYLDKAFSPDKTLRRPARDAWLDKLYDRIEAELKDKKSKLLENQLVSDWWNACQTAKIAADEIYNLLSNENDLAKWRDLKNYFTDWLLLREIASLLTTSADNTTHLQQCDALMKGIFEPYIKDLDNELNPLFTLANKDRSRRRKAIKLWVEQKATITLSTEKFQEIAVKFEFALLVCRLQNKLYYMMNNWQQVQGILNLDISDAMWFDSPPSDFESIIPVMPMGNQLAFQYQKSYQETLGSLQFFRCTGVGRWLLLHFDELFKGDNIASPNILMMSGTSWAGKSPAYHVDVPVSGVLAPRNEEEKVITSQLLTFSNKYNKYQKPLSVSGAGDNKRRNIEQIVTELVKEEYLTRKLDELNGRKILLVVNSYEQVEWVYQCLDNLGWKDKVLPLSPDDEIPDDWNDNQDLKSLQRGQSPDFTKRPEVILIAPLKAIERGHNIVDSEGKAIIGAAYFLVLPHPIPDDLSYAIYAINRWAIDNYKTATGETLKELGNNFRDAAYHQWCHLLHLSVRLRTLPDEDRDAVHWDIIVSLWQAIGRLIRGEANAQVFWCDAKFAPNSAKNEDGKDDTAASSILVGMVNLLRPYFENNPQISRSDRLIVQSLYRPFYQAISTTTNLSGLPQVNV